ncbi:MAG: AAA family ATPase [Candidatus Goldbacteria bacterium]|nr:AAA family ATPase [Candidatus Goldiibacteriota bacterium]
MALSSIMREKLLLAKQNLKKEIVGFDEISNDAHAEVVLGIIKAFGDNKEGFIYIEANLPHNTNQPADIILCDPDTGVIVIEVKGHNINMIDRIVAGTKFFIRKGDKYCDINPWDQARTVMFDIQNEYDRRFRDCKKPWFSYIIALPRIKEKEFKKKFGERSAAFNEILFLDDFENILMLKNKIMDRRLILGHIKRIENPIDKDCIEKVKMLFGDSAVLYRKREERKIEKICLGSKIDEMEMLDKYLTKEQQELSDLTVDGKPRLIRGVAGSGKTIVLANIVAKYIKHLKRLGKQSEFDFDGSINPNIKIAIICFNKTLVPLLKEKIEKSYQNQTGEELKWDDFICIRNFDGFLKQTLVDEGLISKKIWSVDDPNDRSKFLSEEWEKYKNNSINMDKVTKFDVIFVDEGQDLSENEYILLKDLMKPTNTGELNLIIFYDDAQNIYGRKRPNWTNLGINITGRSWVMKDCFRNTRQIINLAYNVLLGSCAPRNVRVNTNEFADLNYLKKLGLVEDKGNWFKVNFASRLGPRPILETFKSEDEEISWVVENVKKLVEIEHVRPEDILVMTCYRKYCDKLVENFNKKIKGVSHIKRTYADEEKNTYIFNKDTLTISTVHSAKGYDAAVVFFVGLHDLTPDIEFDEDIKIKTDAGSRAMFYVGATRAKYLLYLSGTKIAKYDLLDEIEKTHMMLMDKDVYKF